jgi:type VI secretion system protein ImpJ
VPEDGPLGAVDLKPAFERPGGVTVYLAVPRLQLGQVNVRDPQEPPAEGDKAALTRYQLANEEIEDENVNDNPQKVPIRLLNCKLLLSTEDHSGYEVLPIARVKRDARPDALPQLDRTYIPPVVACDAWPALFADILQAVYHIVGKKVELRASQVVSRGITFDSKSQKDPLIFAQLHMLNEGYALLGTLAFAQGIHPLPAYLELCRLVGQLAIFKEPRKTPELPRYDHDDLGGCFYRVKQYLDDLLGEVEEPTYKEREFVGQGKQLQVALQPEWLEPAWQMFVGVDSPLSAEECVELLTQAGALDMKIASSQRADKIFEEGAAGLRFTHNSAPPRALPERAGLIYLEVSRESQLQEWQHVQRSLTLAIRLNQRCVAGNMQGQRILTINTGYKTTTMHFMLYLVPREG